MDKDKFSQKNYEALKRECQKRKITVLDMWKDDEKGRRAMRKALRSYDDQNRPARRNQTKMNTTPIAQKDNTNFWQWVAIVAIITTVVLLAGIGALYVRSISVRTQPQLEAEMTTRIAMLEAKATNAAAEPAPTSTPTATPTQPSTADQTASEPIKSAEQSAEPAAQATVAYTVFDPVKSWKWDKLGAKPTFAEFLKSHGLNQADIQEFKPMDVSWEPAMYVVEFQPELYGQKEIPLLEGWVYTLALADNSVQVMWGGDPNVPTALLQWGFTARWVKPYLDLPYKWLDPADPRELAAREYRFGRYLRSSDMEGVRKDVVYFNRVGPYHTGTGNLDVKGWVPPSLDATVPHDWMDACAMLGGLCNQDEWKFGEKASDGYLNWSWKYSKKVPGSGTYCPVDMPCWQTVYADGPGYVEIWLSAGTTGPDGKPVKEGGPYKFYANDRPILADGLHNVDEFSYHADPSR